MNNLVYLIFNFGRRSLYSHIVNCLMMDSDGIYFDTNRYIMKYAETDDIDDPSQLLHSMTGLSTLRLKSGEIYVEMLWNSTSGIYDILD